MEILKPKGLCIFLDPNVEPKGSLRRSPYLASSYRTDV